MEIAESMGVNVDLLVQNLPKDNDAEDEKGRQNGSIVTENVRKNPVKSSKSKNVKKKKTKAQKQQIRSDFATARSSDFIKSTINRSISKPPGFL